MTLLDMGRNLFDNKVREAGNEFYKAARDLAEHSVPAILNSIEREYGIPGSYLFFVMSRRPQDAKSILGSDYDLAQAARRLWIAKHTDYDAVGRVRVPPSELEPNFDPAMQEFGAWAKTRFLRKLVDVYVAVLRQKAREYIKESGDSVPEKNVRYALYTDVPLRVKDHPFWFNDSSTLLRILEHV